MTEYLIRGEYDPIFGWSYVRVLQDSSIAFTERFGLATGFSDRETTEKCRKELTEPHKFEIERVT